MRLLVLTAVALALASAASAQTQTPTAAPAATPAPPPPAIGAPLSLEQARPVLAAAIAEARRQGFQMAVAIVEPDGSLVAFERIDGVQYGSIEVSQAKARSAALFRRPTLAFSQGVAAGRVQILGLPGAIAIEGGVPLVLNGRLVGAIGVSGGSSEQDGQVAAVGAAALR